MLYCGYAMESFGGVYDHDSRVCCRSLSPVNWENVRVLDDGETVSIDGTHLGHNIPDGKNRYCINLVSIAGNPDECVN